MAAGTKRTQGLLIASQVALTIVLLTGAGTAIRSLVTLYRTDLGYDPHQLLRVTVPSPEGAYPTFESRKAFFEAVHARVASLPEAEFVSFGPFSPRFTDRPSRSRSRVRRAIRIGVSCTSSLARITSPC